MSQSIIIPNAALVTFTQPSAIELSLNVLGCGTDNGVLYNSDGLCTMVTRMKDNGVVLSDQDLIIPVS